MVLYVTTTAKREISSSEDDIKEIHSFCVRVHAALLRDVRIVHHIGMTTVHPPSKNTIDS